MAARVVHKYAVEAAGDFGPVQMPVGAEILHADVQGDQVFVWASVAPEAGELVERRIGYFGTGSPVPGGALMAGRSLVDRADRRYRRELAVELARTEEVRRDRERRRSEMHSYSARPTSDERWGGVV
jgi:hypothetical protein